MIIRSLGLALILAAMAATPAAAEGEEDYARTGPYMGGGLALGWENFDGVPGNFDTGVGFDVWAGQRFHPNFAAELELEYVDHINLSTVDTNFLTFTGNLKAYLATGRCQPFALVGIGVTRFGIDAGVLGSGSESAFGARFGGGLDYYISENVSLGTTASYVLGTGDLDGADYVSLIMGAQYRF
jgi:opacity protein-like surface antigen